MHNAHRERYLACRTCLAVQRLLTDLPLDEGEECFAARHASHRVEPMMRVGEAFLSDRPAWDPLATTYFEVTNGQELLMVRSGRRSIEEPIERVLVPGRLRLDHVAVEFEIALLRRALDAHFFPHALRPAKLEQFIAALQDICAQINPDALEIVFDSAEEPQVQYARLPDELYRRLIARCESVFDDWERERLRGFFAISRADDGLLCLRVTRAFVVEAA